MAEKSPNALRGKCVVVTRAAEQSGPLLEGLRSAGAEAVSLPLVAFTPPDDPGPLEEAVRHLAHYDWLFLTSRNALRALEEHCAKIKRRLAESAASVRIAVVGPATAEAAQSAGLRVSYVAKKHQGVALAEELGAQLRGKQVLLPRSDRANRELIDVLHALGARVVEVVAYKTVRGEVEDAGQVESVLRQGCDAVLFFSPSAAHHLHELLGSRRFREVSLQTAFTAIGPVTEKALRESGVERVILARDTTVSAVLEALSEYFLSSERAGVKRG